VHGSVESPCKKQKVVVIREPGTPEPINPIFDDPQVVIAQAADGAHHIISSKPGSQHRRLSRQSSGGADTYVKFTHRNGYTFLAAPDDVVPSSWVGDSIMPLPPDDDVPPAAGAGGAAVGVPSVAPTLVDPARDEAADDDELNQSQRDPLSCPVPPVSPEPDAEESQLP